MSNVIETDSVANMRDALDELGYVSTGMDGFMHLLGKQEDAQYQEMYFLIEPHVKKLGQIYGKLEEAWCGVKNDTGGSPR